MIGATRGLKVYAYAQPVDMRRSYEGLSAIVREELGRDPLAGHLFVFCNKRCNRAKVLLWDGTGLAIYMKRIEKGRFAPLWRDSLDRVLELSTSELQLFLEGNELVGRLRFSPPTTLKKDLLPKVPPC